MNTQIRTLALATLVAALWQPAPLKADGSETAIRYRNQKVEGVNIFYREAGSAARPTVVLLHGFPSSSHMYRDLIPKLAGQYHVIAADMPGFGYSDQPSPDKFAYTFEHLTEVMDQFLDAIGVEKYSIYVMDYGAPVGFRLFVKNPEKIQAIVSQNGNAYEEGLSPFWAEYLKPYWKERSAETEKKIRGLISVESTKFQYTQGFRNPERVNPDSYMFDQATLDRPGNAEIQLALFYDYRNNVAQYPQWHETLRRVQPPVLAVWGKNDPIFSAPGAEAFRRDVPKAEIRFVDTGHFALEEDVDTIARYMLAFLAKAIR
ncbi:MAG: alpha/beta hydrolase [Bryobacteraceae bacterium]